MVNSVAFLNAGSATHKFPLCPKAISVFPNVCARLARTFVKLAFEAAMNVVVVPLVTIAGLAPALAVICNGPATRF